MHKGFGKLLPVVDLKDRELGLELRSRIHELGLIHRTVNILVFDYHGRVYLQQRSAEKDLYPELWAPSASGHVEEGESYLTAAYRELREELGLTLVCKRLGMLRPQPSTDQAFVAVYAAYTRERPMPNYMEIITGSFYTRKAAWQIALNKDLAVPSLKMVLAMAGRRGYF